jgi:hypothetical protein
MVSASNTLLVEEIKNLKTGKGIEASIQNDVRKAPPTKGKFVGAQGTKVAPVTSMEEFRKRREMGD